MERYIILAVAALTICIAKAITGIGPIRLVCELVNSLMEKLQLISGKRYTKNRTKFAQMSLKQKKESKGYQFYCFLNEILLDMSWKSKGITVEGVNLFIQTITIALTCIIAIFMSNLMLAVVLGVVTYILFIALLFLVSRLNHTRRKLALMDAEDILCASMSQGLVVAVEGAIDTMDPIIQPVFRQFLDEVYNRNVDISTAIDNLNMSCGEQFDLFCEKAKTFERERRPGMENVFQYNISRNSFVRALDRDCGKAFSAMNMDYLLSLAILVGFVLFGVIAFEGTIEFYTSPIGKFLLALYLISVSLVFIVIQYIQSKPFKYGSGIVEPPVSPTVQFENDNQKLTKLFGVMYHATTNPRKSKKGGG